MKVIFGNVAWWLATKIEARPQLSEWLWRALARVVSIPFVANWIIERAMKTPHEMIAKSVHVEPDWNKALYMGRWWFWNPYKDQDDLPIAGANDRWPSVRVNFINRADEDRHNHDHPWEARTIIMKVQRPLLNYAYAEIRDGSKVASIRRLGDTATLKPGEYHRIISVAEGGCWTLFFTWKYLAPWGFKVDDRKINSRDYFEQFQKGAQI